jgi:Dolichyl-phosphate-mannose-protein mannosyltransferase
MNISAYLHLRNMRDSIEQSRIARQFAPASHARLPFLAEAELHRQVIHKSSIHHKRSVNLQWIRRILLVVCVLSLLAFAYAAIASAIFPHDLDQCEGIVLEPALQLTSGRPIYGQPLVMRPPYFYAAYGPLYYLVLGSLLKLTGLAFWPGRLLSLLATAATAWLLYRAVNRRQKTWAGGLLAATLFIMSPAIWPFGFFQRVDALGVFFTTLCVILVWSAAERRRHYVCAGAAAGLAFLVKPTLIAAGLAVIICLITARAFKELRAFLIGGIVILAAGATALLATGNAGYIFNQMVNAQTPFSLGPVVSIVREMIQSHAVIAALAVGGARLLQTDLRNRQVANLLPITYLIIAGGLALMECGKMGAAVNYFYEFFVALALCAGLVISKLERARNAAYLLTALFLLISLSGELALKCNYFIKGYLFVTFSKASLHEKIVQDLRAYVPRGEPVASAYPDLVLRSERPLYFNDITVYMLGPDQVRSRLASCLAERQLAAYVSMDYRTIPGYRLVREPADEPAPPSSRQIVRGPLLYLREDLWQPQTVSANHAP